MSEPILPRIVVPGLEELVGGMKISLNPGESRFVRKGPEERVFLAFVLQGNGQIETVAGSQTVTLYPMAYCQSRSFVRGDGILLTAREKAFEVLLFGIKF